MGLYLTNCLVVVFLLLEDVSQCFMLTQSGRLVVLIDRLVLWVCTYSDV